MYNENMQVKKERNMNQYKIRLQKIQWFNNNYKLTIKHN